MPEDRPPQGSATLRLDQHILELPAPPVGVLLALDTSSASVGYALHDGTTLFAETMWQGQRQGTAMLLDAAMHSLASVGKTKGDLVAIAVATGPGSFSGLRVGLGIAKGLALGLGLPIVGVPTLDATAAPFVSVLPQGSVVCATVAAGRGRYAYALYAGDDLAPTEGPTHATAPEIARVLAAYPMSLVCGEMDTVAEAAFAAVPGVIVPTVGARTRRAGALADLAWRRILWGNTNDLVSLAPVYLHTTAVA